LESISFSSTGESGSTATGFSAALGGTLAAEAVVAAVAVLGTFYSFFLSSVNLIASTADLVRR
jgi:hypothetical protein